MKLPPLVERLKNQSTASFEFARNYLNLPKNRRELTNKRILSSLKKMGVATQAEVRLLQSRLEKLEAKLEEQLKTR